MIVGLAQDPLTWPDGSTIALPNAAIKPFQNLTHIDQQYTYFMGASRARQLLAVVHQHA